MTDEVALPIFMTWGIDTREW